MYAVEYDQNRVVEYTLKGAVVRQWGSAGTAAGQLNSPIRVALDATGAIYVTDTGNNRIQKFSGTGQPLAQWGTLGDAPGQFNFPVGVTVDANGNIYVGDTRKGRVQKLSPSGTPIQELGSVGDGPGQFKGVPGDVALDRQGDIFVTEAYGLNRIYKFSPTRRSSRTGADLGTLLGRSTNRAGWLSTVLAMCTWPTPATTAFRS